MTSEQINSATGGDPPGDPRGGPQDYLNPTAGGQKGGTPEGQSHSLLTLVGSADSMTSEGARDEIYYIRKHLAPDSKRFQQSPLNTFALIRKS